MEFTWFSFFSNNNQNTHSSIPCVEQLIYLDHEESCRLPSFWFAFDKFGLRI